MKKYLFILLLTIAGYGQTIYQNPTFGTVTSKTNVEDNSAEKILVQNSLGKLNWIYKSKLIPDNYTKVVYVNNNNPNGATIFDLNNPPVTNDNLLKSDVNNLYIGTDASTWVYNTPTLNYVTKVVTSATSNFYLSSTSTDAGNTKTASVYRTGKISVGADVSSSDAFTVTGNSKFIGLAKIGDNPVGSTPNRITQNVGLDDWSIYGEATTIDQGKLIFEVGDNGAPLSSNGQAFQFRYNSVSSGVAKNPLTIDYNDITALANVTATSFIKSGAIATHALLAGGGTLSNPIGGTGANGQVSFWNGANSQAGDSGFSWNNSTKALSIISPTSEILSVQNTSEVGRTTLTALNDSGGALGFGITGSSFVTVADFGKAGDAFIRSSLMAKDLNLINANPTEGAIKFINSSVERMRVAFSGNILIGKTTPDTGEKLQVNGNITATSYSGTATLTGNPTAPTPTAGDNDTSIATTAFVTGALPTSGTVLPTTSNLVNISSLSNPRILYTKIGNIVNVSLTFDITETSINTITSFTCTLPVNRTLSTARQVMGGGIVRTSTTPNGVYNVAEVSLRTSATSFDVSYKTAGTVGAERGMINFQYSILD